MPIIFSSQVIEKIVEKIVEKTEYIFRSSGIRAVITDMLSQKSIDLTPTTTISFSGLVRTMFKAYRLLPPKSPPKYNIIKNATKPSPATSYNSYTSSRFMQLKAIKQPKLSFSIGLAKLNLSPTFISIFSLTHKLGWMKMPKLKPTYNIVATPAKPSPTTTQSFSANIRVRKTP